MTERDGVSDQPVLNLSRTALRPTSRRNLHGAIFGRSLTTAYGCIWLLVGVVLIASGFLVASNTGLGAQVGRWIGIWRPGIATLTAVRWLGHYPVCSLVYVGLSVLVICGQAVHFEGGATLELNRPGKSLSPVRCPSPRLLYSEPIPQLPDVYWDLGGTSDNGPDWRCAGVAVDAVVLLPCSSTAPREVVSGGRKAATRTVLRRRDHVPSVTRRPRHAVNWGREPC
jgi:hypothetical protein